MGLLKKVAADITAIKNDYVTNASLTSQLNDLKAQHIADEVKKVDDKAKKNASDILVFENKLKQKEDTVNEKGRGLSFNRGFYFYMDRSYLVYECKRWHFSFDSTNKTKIKLWKSTGIENLSRNSDMDAVGDSGNDLPDIKVDGRIYVYLSGNYFEQN